MLLPLVATVEFPEIVVRLMVVAPEVKMPPPNANAWPPPGAVDVALLPEIVLSTAVIVPSL